MQYAKTQYNTQKCYINRKILWSDHENRSCGGSKHAKHHLTLCCKPTRILGGNTRSRCFAKYRCAMPSSSQIRQSSSDFGFWLWPWKRSERANLTRSYRNRSRWLRCVLYDGTTTQWMHSPSPKLCSPGPLLVFFSWSICQCQLVSHSQNQATGCTPNISCITCGGWGDFLLESAWPQHRADERASVWKLYGCRRMVRAVYRSWFHTRRALLQAHFSTTSRTALACNGMEKKKMMYSCIHLAGLLI